MIEVPALIQHTLWSVFIVEGTKIKQVSKMHHVTKTVVSAGLTRKVSQDLKEMKAF